MLPSRDSPNGMRAPDSDIWNRQANSVRLSQQQQLQSLSPSNPPRRDQGEDNDSTALAQNRSVSPPVEPELPGGSSAVPSPIEESPSGDSTVQIHKDIPNIKGPLEGDSTVQIHKDIPPPYVEAQILHDSAGPTSIHPRPIRTLSPSPVVSHELRGFDPVPATALSFDVSVDSNRERGHSIDHNPEYSRDTALEIETRKAATSSGGGEGSRGSSPEERQAASSSPDGSTSYTAGTSPEFPSEIRGDRTPSARALASLEARVNDTLRRGSGSSGKSGKSGKSGGSSGGGGSVPGEAAAAGVGKHAEAAVAAAVLSELEGRMRGLEASLERAHAENSEMRYAAALTPSAALIP